LAGKTARLYAYRTEALPAFTGFSQADCSQFTEKRAESSRADAEFARFS
jgi:hypothetical protein